ncbi:MAG TPA: dTMP kinase [Thermoplasmata archaeon]|nr:dTMP kinase [Thermoplasmata archaeon]HIH98426.1 dTMP kinase [Thermoplasmata archaeon]
MSKFVVVCGLDGSGKSTQATLLAKWLRSKNKRALLTREPTESQIGNLIRRILRCDFKVSPCSLQLLFAADRADHLEREIEPALNKEKIVVSDRYILSSLAYGSLEVELDFLKKINSGFREPDLTLIIDTPPHVCIERMRRCKTHMELFENEEKMKEIRKNYLALKGYFPNAFIVEGDKKKEEVFDRIKEILEEENL